jgi:glycosyltransferase involved in cell wall biosynthesis
LASVPLHEQHVEAGNTKYFYESILQHAGPSLVSENHLQKSFSALSSVDMKVLMFGWEFPPNISGGLGPACAGISQTLIREGIEVIFVLPRLAGDELADGVTFLDASNIALTEEISTNSIPQEHRTFSSTGTVTTITKQVLLPATFSAYDAPSGHHSVSWWESQKAILHSFASHMSSPEIRIQTGTIERGPYYQFSGSYKHNLLDETIRYAHVAATIAKRESFDVIHIHDWITIPAGIAAKHASGKKLIVHVHSTVYDRCKGEPDPVVLAIEKDGFENADAIIAVSGWTKAQLVSKYQISPDKITVAHNGIELSDNHTTVRIHTFNAPIVTFLGRVTHQKGPTYFVDAAARVLEKFPDTHFVLAGTGDMLEETIMYAARHKLSAHFHFPGFVAGTHLQKLWAMTDVYVMPSVSEPFGLTPLEAIRAGVPTIISNQSGVAEVMPHAIKIDFWDIDAMAQAICSVLQHKSLSSTLSTNARQGLHDINWSTAGRIIKNVYQETLRDAGKKVL